MRSTSRKEYRQNVPCTMTYIHNLKLLRIKNKNSNFFTVDIYKGEQLVSAIDLEGSVIEVVKELTDLFAVLDIDCEVEID